MAYLQGIIADAKESPDFFIGKTLTDSEEQCRREMVYLDDRYLSYRIEEYWYRGGAHGSTTISVGTLDRETGRQLTLNDVFGQDGLAPLESELRQAVIAKIGEENIQSPVKPIENFYLADDGWHFVENEMEGRQPGAFYVGGNCTLGDITLGLYWQHPLRRSVRTDESWTLNRYVQRHFVQTSRDTASLLNLTLTWRLSHGRKYHEVKRSLHLSDDDNGLLQQK